METRWHRTYALVSALFRIDLQEHIAFLRALVKWVFFGSIVGALAGTASAAFLITLSAATNYRLSHTWLVWLLQLAGLALGLAYHRYGGAAARGNNLVIDEVNQSRVPIPLRMAPMVLLGTVITHLFGGSAGREGTAIQMGASLADNFLRLVRLDEANRRLMLMAGISGGFSSVFGTPVAGFVFGLEVQKVGRLRYDGVVPCLAAAIVGDIVTRLWGATHAHYPQLPAIELDPLLLLKVIVAGIVFGLASLLFVELVHGIKLVMARFVSWPPLRPLIGGVLIIGLMLLVGTQDYLGLSLPLIQQSLDGTGVVTFAFLLKIVFTAVTLGTGFLGGEVTPLFVIGATLGYTVGRALGVDPAVMASIGFVAVFAGASNTPLACALMGIELFGGSAPMYLILGCFVAYLASGHRGIYATQRVSTPKTADANVTAQETLAEIAERRKGWLPPLKSRDSSPPEI